MTNQEFINKLLNIVNNYNTVYAYGTFGQKLTKTIINQKAKQYPNWYTESRKQSLLNLVGKNYFCFDCVGLIKGVLWGWNGSNTTNGGAKYESNGVPDINANTMITKCSNISTNFSKIEMGELLWMNGHVGIYYTNNQVIECSPAFKNKVQITNLSQRNWVKHGKLPWITYNSSSFLPPRGYFKKGDSGKNVEKICAFLSEFVKGDYFGDYAVACTKVFQKQNGLEQDGNIGPITLEKMKEKGFIE